MSRYGLMEQAGNAYSGYRQGVNDRNTEQQRQEELTWLRERRERQRGDWTRADEDRLQRLEDEGYTRQRGLMVDQRADTTWESEADLRAKTLGNRQGAANATAADQAYGVRTREQREGLGNKTLNNQLGAADATAADQANAARIRPEVQRLTDMIRTNQIGAAEVAQRDQIYANATREERQALDAAVRAVQQGTAEAALASQEHTESQRPAAEELSDANLQNLQTVATGKANDLEFQQSLQDRMQGVASGKLDFAEAELLYKNSVQRAEGAMRSFIRSEGENIQPIVDWYNGANDFDDGADIDEVKRTESGGYVISMNNGQTMEFADMKEVVGHIRQAMNPDTWYAMQLGPEWQAAVQWGIPGQQSSKTGEFKSGENKGGPGRPGGPGSKYNQGTRYKAIASTISNALGINDLTGFVPNGARELHTAANSVAQRIEQQYPDVFAPAELAKIVTEQFPPPTKNEVRDAMRAENGKRPTKAQLDKAMKVAKANHWNQLEAQLGEAAQQRMGQGQPATRTTPNYGEEVNGKVFTGQGENANPRDPNNWLTPEDFQQLQTFRNQNAEGGSR